MKKKISLLILIISIIYSSKSISETQEYQGVKLRILNKDTTEKSFYTLPLSQTLEINNTMIIVHRCVLKIEEGKQEEDRNKNVEPVLIRLRSNDEDDYDCFVQEAHDNPSRHALHFSHFPPFPLPPLPLFPL